MGAITLPDAMLQIADALRHELGTLPSNFCSGFHFTMTGRNLTHPILVGAIGLCVRGLSGVRHVGIDVRMSVPGEKVKFQPDIVAYGEDLDEPLLIVDYESPNSSDLRIVDKDIAAYGNWARHTTKNVPYVVVTTLPSVECPDWQIRYRSYERFGGPMRDKEDLVRKSPLRFWMDQWLRETKKNDLESLGILNIDGREVTEVKLQH